ncbi:MAG TPA: hypothetical protein PK156_05660 [Polyangium sp.]|nr:hypothetical protein [Polyangium sp.]
MGRVRRRVRPYLAAIVILVLVLVQARAVFIQYERGYRLFRHEPSRVAFSWDMFAQRITRCDIEWNPPLKSKSASDERIGRMRSLAPYFEWNPVLHDAADYLSLGRRACAKYGDGPARTFTLTCYYPGFRETRHVVACE